MPAGFSFIVSSIVLVNLALGIFNLVPIPHLMVQKLFLTCSAIFLSGDKLF